MLGRYTVQLTAKRRLCTDTEELTFERPPGLSVQAGQKIRFFQNDMARDYTLINAPDQNELAVCVRRVDRGRFSPAATRAAIGTAFQISAPFGYFTYQPSPRTAVFVATGTGIAPFVAFSRSGVRGFTLLHGVKSVAALYYSRELTDAARTYVACISDPPAPAGKRENLFSERVTHYLEEHLPAGSYDFYLCGRSEMIEEATRILDQRFPAALVYTEQFY